MSSPSTPYGSASFLEGRALKRLLNSKNQGFAIAGPKVRMSLEDSFRHCAVLAPTGAGKTTRFIAVNTAILASNNAKNRVSQVITDPSGEVYALTHKYLRQFMEVKVLRVDDLQNTMFFNPIERCKNYTETMKLADILVNVNLEKTVDEFWNESAKDLLTVLIQSVRHLAPSDRTLGMLHRLIKQLGIDSEKDQVHQIVAKHADPESFDTFRAFSAMEDKQQQNVLSNCRTALRQMGDPAMRAITAKETLHFESIRTKPTALFLIVPEHSVRQYAFLMTIFYWQLFSYCMRMPTTLELPVLFLLDEFANLGKLPDASMIMTTLRKRSCGVALILQDLSGLEKVYGSHDASIIINGGCASRLYYPGLGLKECEALERTLGKKTIVRPKYKRNAWGFRVEKTGEDKMSRSLLTADEIRTLPKDKALFIHGNQRPALLSTKPWWEIPFLKRNLKI